MNLTRYTQKAHEGILAAQQLAEQSHHPQIDPEHLLLTLVEQADGVVPSVLRRLSVEPARILEEGRALLDRQPEVHGGAEAGPSPRLRAVASLAESEADRLTDEYVSTEHLLLALTLEGDRAASAQLLARHGVTTERVFEALSQIRGGQRVTDQHPEGKYEALERYGRDLTELAGQGEAGPGDRPGRGDSTRRPGAVATHKEQPGADR